MGYLMIQTILPFMKLLYQIPSDEWRTGEQNLNYFCLTEGFSVLF